MPREVQKARARQLLALLGAGLFLIAPRAMAQDASEPPATDPAAEGGEGAEETAAPDDGEPANEQAGEFDAEEGEGEEPAIEFVEEGPNPFEKAEEPMSLPTQEEIDEKAPTIDDFAVAAGNPDAPVRVTAVVTDDVSGIEAVDVFYKIDPAAPEFDKVTLEAQTGGLFMGIFPDGPQRSGFVYYAEAKDAAGNVERLGDPEEPYKVSAAKESGLVKLERSRYEPESEPLVAPIWIAITLGAGVVGAAGASLFLIDFARLYFFELANEPMGTERYTLISQLAIGDLAIGGVLGVLGAAALATGTGLLIYSAIEE